MNIPSLLVYLKRAKHVKVKSTTITEEGEVKHYYFRIHKWEAMRAIKALGSVNVNARFTHKTETLVIGENKHGNEESIL